MLSTRFNPGNVSPTHPCVRGISTSDRQGRWKCRNVSGKHSALYVIPTKCNFGEAGFDKKATVAQYATVQNASRYHAEMLEPSNSLALGIRNAVGTTQLPVLCDQPLRSKGAKYDG